MSSNATDAAPAAPDQLAQRHRANLRGIRMMVLAMSLFIVNDSIAKYVSAGVPTGQLIVVRGLFATAFVLLMLRASGTPAPLHQLTRGWVALRAMLDGLATLSYLGALFHLPIGNATAINMATPLFVTLLAALWLRMRVTPAQALAVVVGFGGVLLIIQPRSSGFNAWAWLSLLSALFSATRDLVTTRIAASVPSTAITLATSVLVTLMAAALSLWQGWVPLALAQVVLLAVAGLFLALGYQCIVRALRGADIAAVAPFRYTGLLGALLLGYVVWGEVPNALAWCGIALVISAGLALLRRAA